MKKKRSLKIVNLLLPLGMRRNLFLVVWIGLLSSSPGMRVAQGQDVPRPIIRLVSIEELRMRASAPDRTSLGRIERSVPTGGLAWTFLGPQPILNEYWSGNADASGRVSSIVVHPSNPNLIYLAAAQGGVWKSSDGGVTWAPLTDQLSSLASGALAIDTANPNVLYYGTGEQHYSGDSFPGDGLFMTSDSGGTWNKIAMKSTVGSYIARVVAKSGSSVVHVCSDLGYVRSVDGGTTWTVFNPGGWCNDLVGGQGLTVTDLGTLPGGFFSSAAAAINDSTQVVGWSGGPGFSYHTFLWENGVMRDLGTLPGGNESRATGINASGQVVGWSGGTGFSQHAFLWENGMMRDLGTLPGTLYSGARGINASGQVVGFSSSPPGHAFLWESGTMTDLGTLPGGTESYATGINASGQVVGWSEVTGFGKHAFLWENGMMRDLGTLPGGNDGEAWGINDSGQVVGFSNGSGFLWHAFLWENGVMRDLGTLPGGTQSYAFGINASGQVVGHSYVPGFGDWHAFLWENGRMVDISQPNWVQTFEYAINDSGQIVGQGINQSAQNVATLLTPAPLFAAFYGHGIYRSTDDGASWTQLTNGLPVSGFTRINLAIAPSNPSVLYASFVSPGGSLLGMYKTTNGGSTWSLLASTPNYLCTQGLYDNAVAVSPSDPNTVYAAGVFPYDVSCNGGVIKSSNGGTTWTNVTRGGDGTQVHPDQHVLTFGPDGGLYVGSDGGIWKTTNGLSWMDLNHALGITQFYSVGVHPTDSNFLIGGSQDNGTAQYQGLLAWPQVIGGDGGPTAVEWADPDVFYTTYVNLNPLYKWRRPIISQGVVTGPWAGERADWANSPLTVDPNLSNTLLAGTFRVWRTTNSGGSWTPISPDLTLGGVLRAIAVTTGSSTTLYTGSSDGQVYVTTDSGITWNLRNLGLPSAAVPDIVVAPVNSQKAYLCVDRPSGGRVFSTDNGGVTWRDITGDLSTGLRAMSLAIDFSTLTFFLGTDYGVYSSSDGGIGWVQESDLPSLAVYSVRVDSANHWVVAATHGRGMWRGRL